MGGNNVQHARKNTWVHNQFDMYPPNPGTKSEIGACRHCKDSKNPPPFKRSWNTSIMEDHLKGCKPYKAWLDNQRERRTQGLPDEKKQKKLVFQPASGTAFSKEKLDHLWGMAVFTSCASFRQFETSEWMAFFKALGYTPLTRQTLVSTVLDNCYETVKSDVDRIIDSSSNIGIVSDESTNISGTRIENVSVVVKGTSYFWSNESLEDKNATADTIIKSIKQKALDITKGDLKRLGSLLTDTCPTM
jgi:hypothetical protein